MFYSLTVLLIGVYLGQELNLPLIKNIFHFFKENSVDSDTQTNYFTRFIDFTGNKQKSKK